MTISLYLVSFSDKLTSHTHIFFLFCATLGIRKIYFYYGRSLCICMHTVAVTRYLLDYDYQQKVLNHLSCLSFVQMCYQIIMMLLKTCYFKICSAFEDISVVFHLLIPIPPLHAYICCIMIFMSLQ